MKKKFVSNLILVLFLNLLIKPFYILGIDAEVLKVTELNQPGSYGNYFSLLSLSFVLNIFLDLGINNFNTRNIAQNNQLITKHFSGIFSLRLILGFAYLIILFIIGVSLGYSNYQIKWLIVLGVNQVLIALILFFRSNLSALLHFKEDSIISVTDRLLLIIFCGLIIWGGFFENTITIELFIITQTIAYSLTAFISFILVYRKTKLFKLTWDLPFFMTIIKKSFPFALLIFLMSVYYYSDAVMLERIHPEGKIEAASYAFGYRFFMAFNMVGFLFASLLLPIFSKMLKENQNIKPLTWLAFKLIFCFSMSQRVAMAQLQLQLAQSNPESHNLQEAYRRMYLALGVDNIEALLPPPPQPQPTDPGLENSISLLGKPLKAFEGQDHQAHIEAHRAFMSSMLVKSNLPVMSILQAHISEHISLMARQTVMEQMAPQMQQMQQDPRAQQQMQMQIGSCYCKTNC